MGIPGVCEGPGAAFTVDTAPRNRHPVAMHTLSFRNLSLACALVFTSACGDDKGTTDDSTGTTTATTPATTTATTPATATATATETGGATMTEASVGTTSDEQTTTPTTGMTSDPTEDPTSGPSGSFCQEQCTADEDCTFMGMPSGLTCKEGRCAGDAPSGCADDNACRATFSGWVTTCATQAECPGQACVDIGGGAGRCATVPSEFVMCETFMQKEIQIPAIEGGMDLTVCANTDFVCEDMACRNPCEDNLSCAMAAGHPQCNAGTGNCECTSDDDCKNSGVAGFATCKDGTCGCGVDADCEGAPNADVCTKDGFCGCSDASACTTKAFDGTVSVCEGF